MSAAAMTCAISPPMTPAPTTAALNTNMALTLAARDGLQLHIPAPLAGEAGEAVRRSDASTRGGRRGGRRAGVNGVALLELVVELERTVTWSGRGTELDALGAAQAASSTRSVWPARGSYAATTSSSTLPRPPGRLSHISVPSAGQPSGSSGRVPKPSSQAGQRCGSYHSASASEARPGTWMATQTPAHQPRTTTSPRIASIEPAMRSSRGASSARGARTPPGRRR